MGKNEQCIDVSAPRSSKLTTATRVAQTVGMGVWKRVAVYPIVAVILGQGLACRRPSVMTDVLLLALSALGALGAMLIAFDVARTEEQS
jgi:hypothetical protein